MKRQWLIVGGYLLTTTAWAGWCGPRFAQVPAGAVARFDPDRPLGWDGPAERREAVRERLTGLHSDLLAGKPAAEIAAFRSALADPGVRKLYDQLKPKVATLPPDPDLPSEASRYERRRDGDLLRFAAAKMNGDPALELVRALHRASFQSAANGQRVNALLEKHGDGLRLLAVRGGHHPPDAWLNDQITVLLREREAERAAQVFYLANRDRDPLMRRVQMDALLAAAPKERQRREIERLSAEHGVDPGLARLLWNEP